MRHSYFTFGQGSPFKNCYVEIIATLDEQARQVMVETFGEKWAFQYTPEKWKGQVEEWHYVKLCTIAGNAYGNFRVVTLDGRIV